MKIERGCFSLGFADVKCEPVFLSGEYGVPNGDGNEIAMINKFSR